MKKKFYEHYKNDRDVSKSSEEANMEVKKQTSRQLLTKQTGCKTRLIKV